MGPEEEWRRGPAMGPRAGPQAAGLGPGGNDALERNVARLFRHHVGIAREVELSTPSLVGGMRHKGTLIWQLTPVVSQRVNAGMSLMVYATPTE